MPLSACSIWCALPGSKRRRKLAKQGRCLEINCWCPFGERNKIFLHPQRVYFYSVDSEGRKEKLFLRAAGCPIGPSLTSRWEPRFWCCMGFGVSGVSSCCQQILCKYFGRKKVVWLFSISDRAWISESKKSSRHLMSTSLVPWEMYFYPLKQFPCSLLMFRLLQRYARVCKYPSPTLLPCFKN